MLRLLPNRKIHILSFLYVLYHSLLKNFSIKCINGIHPHLYSLYWGWDQVFFIKKESSRALIWKSIISLSIYFKFIIVYSIKVNSLINLFWFIIIRTCIIISLTIESYFVICSTSCIYTFILWFSFLLTPYLFQRMLHHHHVYQNSFLLNLLLYSIFHHMHG